MAKKTKSRFVLTAHQADDVAETVLWRFATGDLERAGILPRYGREIRPLLNIWKKDIYRYLKEHDLKSFEDVTNHESDLLRSRIRRELWPPLEKVFPNLRKRLHSQARSRQA